MLLVLLSLAGGCAAAATVQRYPPAQASVPSPALEQPARRQRPPLWRALELLDDALAEGEWRLMQGLPVPSSRMTHLRLTRSAADLFDRGKGARAAGLLEQAIAADSHEGFAYLYLGKFYLESGRRDEGALLLERAAALLPDDTELARQVRRLRFEGDASSARRLHAP